MKLLGVLSSLMIAGGLTAAGGHASAQGLQVTGTVTDSTTGVPLTAVSVQLSGTDIAVLTNTEGEYQIDSESPGDTLTFVVIGFISKSVAIGDRSVVDVSLRPSPHLDLQDFVTSPYGRSAGSGCGGFHDPAAEYRERVG